MGNVSLPGKKAFSRGGELKCDILGDIGTQLLFPSSRGSGLHFFTVFFFLL